jgi:DDE superfamily endonuclease
MWVPPEIKDPILRHAPTRKSVACFGAVSLDTGQFVRMMCPIFNAATFRSFLRRLLRQQTPGRRMIVVLDNARYHHARLLADFLHRKARLLRLLFLPPYSPRRRGSPSRVIDPRDGFPSTREHELGMLSTAAIDHGFGNSV